MFEATAFFNIDFFVAFCYDFSRFWVDFGRPGPSKKLQKMKKIAKTSLLKRIWSALGVPRSLWKGLASVLGMVWESFGRFGEGFGRVWGSQLPAQMSTNKAVSNI